jgi:PE-PPE domain
MILGGPVAGRHRKPSQVPSSVAKRGGTGLAAAALTATGLSTAVVTGTTAAVAPNVQLMALVSAANSTSQFFAGSTYYGTDWTGVYGPQTVVPFLSGPQGIADAISSHSTDSTKTGVTASGWGAGQTGTALGILANNSDPNDLKNVGLVILDNNSNRAGGGFWTTYSAFAPLLATSADPTPSTIPGLTVLDVAYVYNINSDAPVDPLNPFALGNSLAAYAYGYGQESTALDITQATPGGPAVYTAPDGVTKTTLKPGSSYVVDGNGTIHEVASNLTDANGDPVTTTYVTVDTGELPLTRPLRLLPGGDIIADAIDPTMTQLVNAGYNDGKGLPGDPAIPANPAITRPMQPGSSLTGLGGVPASIPAGLEQGVGTATQDITNPTNFITKPLGEVGSLPGISSLSGLAPSTLTNSSVSSSTLNASDPNKFLPGVLPGKNNNSSNGSSGGATGLKNFTEQVKDAVGKVTGGLTGAKPAANNGGS